MMNRTLTPIAGAAAAVLLFGCTGTPDPTPTSQASTAVAPSSTPTPSMSAGQVEAAATVENYYLILNEVGTATQRDFNDIREAAVGEVADPLVQAYQQYRAAGIVQTGEYVVDVRSVEGRTAPYMVEACVDATGVDLVDTDGKSIIAPGTNIHRLHGFTVDTVGDAMRITADDVLADSC